MPPELALVLCIGLIIWLLRLDRKFRQSYSPSLLIGSFWVAIISSRPVAYWMGIVGLGDSIASDLEGSWTNSIVFATLIVGALCVLWRRKFEWRTFIRRNGPLVAVYVYFTFSTLWSDYPITSLKRLIKDFGSVVVALMLLSETDPMLAVRVVCVRVASILFPLSFMLNKYFPAIARSYSKAGEPMLTGVTTHKNSLGQMVLVLSLFLIYDLIIMRRSATAGDRIHIRIRYGMLMLGAWLLMTCQSRTSFVCLLFCILVLWGSGFLIRMRHPLRVLTCAMVLTLCLMGLESSFHIVGGLVEVIGRNTTLTGRTDIWRILREQPIDPIFGCGFDGFWDSRIGQVAMEEVFNVKTAHNGYIEVYLSGGIIGVALLIIMLLHAGKTTLSSMLKDGSMASRVGFAVWSVAIIYNLSESSYFMLLPVWFAFLLMTIRSSEGVDARDDSMKDGLKESVSSTGGFCSVTGTGGL